MSQTHTCPVPTCPTTISNYLVMCKTHWYRVPLDLRNRLWDEVVPGQLDGTVSPSDAYLAVLQDCLQALKRPVAAVGTRRRAPRRQS
jgi:hypothetical protein